MKIVGLYAGKPKKELFGDKQYVTAIIKEPFDGPLELMTEGFPEDGQADRKHHGGPDKAVCVYCAAHYEAWENELGENLPDAAFGENFTVSGLSENDISIGDVIEVGTALCQVTQPRQPCKTLAARLGRQNMVKLVVDSGRTGFYLRVLKEGRVRAGDSFVIREHDSEGITVAEANHIRHHDRQNVVSLRRILRVSTLSAAWRESLEKLLSDALASQD